MPRLASKANRAPADVRPEARDLQAACLADLETLAVALNPFFAENFEAPQRALMKALTNWRRGLPITLLDGTTVNPKSVTDPYDLFACFFPRDTFKSTIICELFVIWLCLYWVIERGEQPAIYLFQATLDKAKLHLAQIKRMMCSDPFYAIFPMFVPRHRDPDKWGTSEYLDLPCVSRSQGRREHSIQVASIGAAFTGHHGTDIINDDPVTQDNFASETEQTAIYNGLQLQDNLSDTRTGLRYQVGTPYSGFDANVRCIQGDLGKPLLFLQTAFDEPPDTFFEWANPRTTEDRRKQLESRVRELYKLAFPNRLTLDVLAGKFRRQGSRFFSSQQLLSVRDDSKNIFRREWFEASLVSLAEAMKRTAGKRRVLIVDSAWKKPHNKGTGDDSAIGVLGYDKEGSPYLLDLVVSDTMTEAAGMSVMSSLIARWQVGKVVKETYGEDNFSTHWRDFCKSGGRKYVPISTPRRESKTGKENRIRALAPAFELGEFFVVDSLAALPVLRKQMLDYSGEGSGRDDILDMMADAIHVEVKARPEASADEPQVWQTGYAPMPTVSSPQVHAPMRVRFDPNNGRSGWALPTRPN